MPFKTQIITFLSNLGVTTNVESFFDSMTNWKLSGQDIYITREKTKQVLLCLHFMIHLLKI